MTKNLVSLGLLRNGKVYASKALAIQGLTQVATNDGVAKLARYLDSTTNVIRTIVGFYADANSMEDNGGGQSSYTVLDVDGNASDIQSLSGAVDTINDIIGGGIDGTTLTNAINDINDRIGDGFSAEHTIAQTLSELRTELIAMLTISLSVAAAPTSGYLKTYVLTQGETEIGRIDIPKDLVVSSGSLVHGTGNGDVFTEDPQGTDTAIKLVIANQENPIYINTKDLVDFYTGGNGIVVDNTANTISVVIDANGEPFLTVGTNGIKLAGVQAAINKAVDDARLEASNGISISSNKVKAVAAKFSDDSVKNPITVNKDGIKFSSTLDCGYFDEIVVIATTAQDVNAIVNTTQTTLFVKGDEAVGALGTKKTFKNVEITNVHVNHPIYLVAENAIIADGVEIGGTNGRINYSAPNIDITDIDIASGSNAYNVFEGDATSQNLERLNITNVTVDNPSLMNDVCNVYSPKDYAVINIKDSQFNLTVDKSNVLRVTNLGNAEHVTINFENVEWTYENSLTTEDWRFAGLLEYQPSMTDVGLSGDLSNMRTWTFNFKNCKYNGKKVTSNNFGEHSQVFYMYNVGNDHSIKDAVVEGLTVNFI